MGKNQNFHRTDREINAAYKFTDLWLRNFEHNRMSEGCIIDFNVKNYLITLLLNTIDAHTTKSSYANS